MFDDDAGQIYDENDGPPDHLRAVQDRNGSRWRRDQDADNVWVRQAGAVELGWGELLFTLGPVTALDWADQAERP
jgi:hypothetical protein